MDRPATSIYDVDNVARDASDHKYHCPACDVPFTRRSNLRRHYAIHTRLMGSKPDCENCKVSPRSKQSPFSTAHYPKSPASFVDPIPPYPMSPSDGVRPSALTNDSALYPHHLSLGNEHDIYHNHPHQHVPRARGYSHSRQPRSQGNIPPIATAPLQSSYDEMDALLETLLTPSSLSPSSSPPSPPAYIPSYQQHPFTSTSPQYDGTNAKFDPNFMLPDMYTPTLSSSMDTYINFPPTRRSHAIR